MKSAWGWQTAPEEGLWGKGPAWLRVMSLCVPWITVALALLMLHLVSGRMTLADGVVFDLPTTGLGETEVTPLVALVISHDGDRLVFFDDARYLLDDDNSVSALGDHIAERVVQSSVTSMLLFVDKRVDTGTLMGLASLARLKGVKKLLIANKREESEEL